MEDKIDLKDALLLGGIPFLTDPSLGFMNRIRDYMSTMPSIDLSFLRDAASVGAPLLLLGVMMFFLVSSGM